MTDYCEIVEDVADATSSCPATDVIMVVVSNGSGSSWVEFSPFQLAVSTAAATSSLPFEEGYALLISNGAGSSSALSAEVIAGKLLTSTGNSSSTAFTEIVMLLESAGVGSSSIPFADAPSLLESHAAASSQVFANTTANKLLVSSGVSASSVLIGLYEFSIGTAAATSVVEFENVAATLLISTGNGASSLFANSLIIQPVLISSGAGSSALIAQTDHQDLLVDAGCAISSVFYKNPDQLAWVMNTESTGVSWYDNYGFESIAQIGDKVLAVSSEGLFEITGIVDDGEAVTAEVRGGFNDFGDEHVKRIDQYYIGYTCQGQLSVTVEVQDSNLPPYTYLTDAYYAEAPRNSRVTPGKGLWGRYWRTTFKNVDGADFQVHGVSTDIAVSNRRL